MAGAGEPERNAAAGQLTGVAELLAWVAYLRDMGVYDLYLRASPSAVLSEDLRRQLTTRSPLGPQAVSAAPPEPARTHGSPPPAVPETGAPGRRAPGPPGAQTAPVPGSLPASAVAGARTYFSPSMGIELETPLALPPELAAPMPKPQPLESLAPPAAPIAPAERQTALDQLQAEIGDCTLCPLAYAGRHTVVFGEGDPNARLMFVGEGPGADEDTTGRPFVGKAGQLLNNMIGAMGLTREQVYIANIVKCRPPGNRNPEFVEATTCAPFLLRQIDIVQPQVIVALGSTAATYVLGVRQSLASMRGQWFRSRGAKVAVTYHPAFLLRDPRQKAEAWKDLQRVMHELELKPSRRS